LDEVVTFDRTWSIFVGLIRRGSRAPSIAQLQFSVTTRAFRPTSVVLLSYEWRFACRGRFSEALLQLDPLWDTLFPAEQARIVQLLVERVDVRTHGVEVRLRPNGLAGLVLDVAGSRRAAA
jgi:hypothetical protein